MSLILSLKFSENIPTHVENLLERIADCSRKYQWEIALILSTIALEELEKTLEADSHDVGLILLIVGFTNLKVDKYDEAESTLRRAISVLEKYNEESNVIVAILWTVIISFLNDKRYDTANFFCEKVIGIFEKNDTSGAFDLLGGHNVAVGEACLQLKEPDEAKKFLRAALPVSIEEFGIDSVEVEKIFELLEAAYFWTITVAESEELFENSNEITDVTPLCLLGMLCEDENLPSKAVDYYKRAVKIFENKSSPDDSQLAYISLKLGKCYLKIGNRLGSQLYLNKSCAIYKKTLADDDPVMLDVRFHQALCCGKLECLDEARKIYEEILGNVYTDGSAVPILKLAEDYERSGEDKSPILNGKFNIIDCALKNLSAVYVLDGKYRAAKILQDFAESRHDLIEEDGI